MPLLGDGLSSLSDSAPLADTDPLSTQALLDNVHKLPGSANCTTCYLIFILIINKFYINATEIIIIIILIANLKFILELIPSIC